MCTVQQMKYSVERTKTVQR